MNVFVLDRLTYNLGSSKRQYTDEGYLIVPGKVARSGVQSYLAYELGIKDRNPTDIVNVYRPEEEVFNPASLSTYQDKDVTNDHPSKLVDAESYKAVSVGHIRSKGAKDGDFVVTDMIIKDKQAIDDVESGKVELSAGYTAEYVYEPGVTKDGQEYEYVQRNIVINHVALVDRARAGREATLFDSSKEIIYMGTVTLDSGVSVEVADKNAATMIQSTIDNLKKEAENANASLVKAEDAAAKLEATNDSLKEQNEELQKLTSDSAIEARVNERVALCDSARSIIEDYDATGKTDKDIKVDICKAAFPKRSFDGKSDAYIEACYDQAMEEAKEKKEKQEEEDKETKDSFSALASDAANLSTKDAATVRTSAYDNYVKSLQGESK
ncbi:head maturation protease [Vibrio phage vB_VpM-pA2SJ1]|uniref:Head maturation protease n=1 Tax=Vibrio phage vB_VpM-pA2SJ1 TaxID=3095964 RepID=A0AAX4J5W9_9CAUD